MQKAIAYIRVSTDRQAAEGVSLDAQRGRIDAWCKANDYTLIDTYSDAGLSGSRADNRPALQDALNAACKVRGTALVVYSLSRLARSTKDTLAIAERLDKAGADLVSLSERIDTSSAAGKMVFRLLGVLNEFERDLVSERTRSAMQHKKANGQRVGTIPFGFDLAPDGRTLVENTDEQRVIREIRDLRASGKSYRRIARVLTERGIATKSGRTTWAGRSVQQIHGRTA